jgi:VWA domain-containing protein
MDWARTKYPTRDISRREGSGSAPPAGRSGSRFLAGTGPSPASMSSPTPEAPADSGAERERFVLVLDLSKSMLAPLPDPQGGGGESQKIAVARTAVYRILENAANTGAHFGLVTFTDVVRVAVPLTEIRPENLPYIESLISMLTPAGRSAIWDALALGADLLRGEGGAVRGTLVLVTDGWDNASNRYRSGADPRPDPARTKQDIVPALLPENSKLTLRVIGIGSGGERDKGVDAVAMQSMLGGLSSRARELGVPEAFRYQEVVTGSQLFAQMVNAFLDVGFEGARPLEHLHPEELARSAATAARALKEPQQHAIVGRLASPNAPPPADGGASAPDPARSPLEVDVLTAPGGAVPPYLRERYGPLGGVIEAYLMQDYDTARQRLERSKPVLPAVTYQYWAARVHFAKGEIVEAARALLEAWQEADRLPVNERPRVSRRLALLQARIQNDRETEALVHFMDDTEARTQRVQPEMRDRLRDLFDRLMELRTTYQLTRLGTDPVAQSDGAVKHEAAVEEVFGRLQDARLENVSGDAAVEGALDFIEICLAEMR